MPSKLPDELTLILNQAAKGDQDAAEQAWCTVYGDLRDIATRTLGTPRLGERRSPGPTTVVQRAFLAVHELALNGGASGDHGDHDDHQPWENRRAFFVAIARELARFLIQHRRTHPANGRGGFARVLPLDLDFDSIASFDAALLATDAGVFDSLIRLEDDHLRAAEVVWLRYVCGLTIDQSAELLGVKSRTVCKHWNYAKAWIRRDLEAALGRKLPVAV
jgi:RNA polymerase sigma factor (TIGR02999 family)